MTQPTPRLRRRAKAKVKPPGGPINEERAMAEGLDIIANGLAYFFQESVFSDLSEDEKMAIHMIRQGHFTAVRRFMYICPGLELRSTPYPPATKKAS